MSVKLKGGEASLKWGVGAPLGAATAQIKTDNMLDSLTI